MKITSKEIILTEEEILKADKEIELKLLKNGEPEFWQSYLAATDDVKNIIRVIVFWPQDQLQKFIKACEHDPDIAK